MQNKPIRLAIANTPVTADATQNADVMCSAIAQAAERGAALVLFAEGALSGYVKSQIKSWDDVNWAAVDRALEQVAAQAEASQIMAVFGCNRRAAEAQRPFNSLYTARPDGRLLPSYDKRFLSHTEITDWYRPGFDPAVIEVAGWRFGLSLCIEARFPEVFSEYEELGADAVLLASHSRDPMDWVTLRGHANCNCLWIALSTPPQDPLPGGLIGPDGSELGRVSGTIRIYDLDKCNPEFDVALTKARPWRRLAREGEIYR